MKQSIFNRTAVPPRFCAVLFNRRRTCSTEESAAHHQCELFFGDPKLSAQISPDGFIAFIKPFKGTRNVWSRTDEPFDKARPITADTTRPIPGYLSRDGKFILFVRDKGGDELSRFTQSNPTPVQQPAEKFPRPGTN